MSLDSIVLGTPLPKWLHKHLQKWGLQHHKPVTRLIRSLLFLVNWSHHGGITYSITVPLSEHDSTEKLKIALDTAVAAILAEAERREDRSTESWSN